MKNLFLISIIAILFNSCSNYSISDYCYTGLIPIEYSEPHGRYPSEEFSYITHDGKEMKFNDVSPCYYAGSLFSDGLALVEQINSNEKGARKRVFINEKGEVVIKLSDYNISLSNGCSGFWNGYAIIASTIEKDDEVYAKYLVVNTAGEVVLELPFTSDENRMLTPMTHFHEGYMLMKEYRTNRGILYNLKGEVCLEVENPLSPLLFNQISTYKSDGRDSKYGTIDIKGNVVVPFIYNRGIIYNVEGYAITEDENDAVCVIDTKGKVVVKPGKFKSLEYYGNGVYRGLLTNQDDLKYRWYDIKGNLVKVNGSEIDEYINKFDKYGLYRLNVPRLDNKYYALGAINDNHNSALSITIIDPEKEVDIIDVDKPIYSSEYIDGGTLKVWDELNLYCLYGMPYTTPIKYNLNSGILF